MAKDPAFLFYSSDFLTGTMTFSDEQVGRYIRLLCLQHQKGELSMKEIEKICGQDEEILQKFAVQPSGKFANTRLLEETKKRTEHAEMQRKKIQKYWDSKRTEEQQKYNSINNSNSIEHSKAIPLENEDEIEIENINDSILSLMLEKWKSKDLVFTGSNLIELREIAEKILSKKDLSQITTEEKESCLQVFDSISNYAKENAKYYGSISAVNKHLDKIVNAIKKQNGAVITRKGAKEFLEKYGLDK